MAHANAYQVSHYNLQDYLIAIDTEYTIVQTADGAISVVEFEEGS